MSDKTQNLSKDAFLKQDKEENFKLVEVKGIPGFDPAAVLYMQPLSQSARAEIDDKLLANATTGADGSKRITSLKSYKIALVAQSIVEPETRKPLFKEEEVATFSSKVFDFLHRKASIISGMNLEAVEGAKGN